jgi:hypothetical protein
MQGNDDAMFYPLLPKSWALSIVFSMAVLISLCIVFLPENGELPPSIFLIHDALSMGEKSKFNFALTITYSLAVYASLFCGLLTAFTKGDLKGLAEIRARQSKTFRILSDSLIVVFFYLLLTQELPVNSSQFSHSFFASVLQHRFSAFAWVVGVFSFLYCMVIVCLFDISALFKRILYK